MNKICGFLFLVFVICIRKSKVHFVCKDDDEQTTLDCDAIFEENFLKLCFKKFSSKIARKDEWRKLAKTNGGSSQRRRRR